MSKFHEFRRCRYEKCRSKLPIPTDNKYKAFCTPGCYNSFHLSRCIVCEKEKPNGSRSNRLLCRRPKCKTDFQKNRSFFLYPVRTSSSPPELKKVPVNRALKTASTDVLQTPFWVDREGRGWRFEPTGTGYRLLDRDGRQAVRIDLVASDEDIYRVSVGKTIPHQTSPTLCGVFELAKKLALGALPLDPQTAAQLARGNDWDRIRSEIAKRRRSTAAADYGASFRSPDDTAPGYVLSLEEQTRLAGLLKQIPQDLSIPEFLRAVK